MKIQVNKDVRAIVFEWPFTNITSDQLAVFADWLFNKKFGEPLPVELAGLEAKSAFFTNEP
jgi:hypothetical protein